MLSHAITEILADLRLVTGVKQAPNQPLEQINETPTLIAYPETGDSLPIVHADEDGNPVVGGDWPIVIEWRDQYVDLATGLQRAIPITDAIITALWAGFHRDKFNGSVARLASVQLQTMDLMPWGDVPFFGVRLIVTVRLHDAIVITG